MSNDAPAARLFCLDEFHTLKGDDRLRVYDLNLNPLAVRWAEFLGIE